MKHLQKIFLSLLFLFFLSFSLPAISFAQQIQYPVSQLGNCRDQKECFYYCEISYNAPACWSYGKYILHKDVLGVSTQSADQIAKEHGITFPITELGNCNSVQECMQYCNIPANQQACTDFGHKKGLVQQDANSQPSVDENKILSDAKVQLGCTSKDACMQYCNIPANQEQCQSFAQKEGLKRNQSGGQNTTSQQDVSSAVIQAAKQELGCDSEQSCKDYCNNPDHYQKCQQFAKENNLSSQGDQQGSGSQQMGQQSSPSGTQSLPPCKDPSSCMQWCKDNPDKCNQKQGNQDQHGGPNQYNGTAAGSMLPISPNPSFQKEGMMQQFPQGNYPQQTQPSRMGGCTSDQDCYAYCQSHPDQCPGFGQKNQNSPSGYVNSQTQPNQQPFMQGSSGGNISQPPFQQQNNIAPANNQPPVQNSSNIGSQQTPGH